MRIEAVRERVRGLPHMTSAQSEAITALVLENEFEQILELGFDHGVSTCFMAGALDELGRGRITTIDLLSARRREPNLETLLADLGLSAYVTPYYEPTSYVWRLMRMLEEDPSARFDFCYLDGAHDWFVDGFAFFLVDRLLKPGGMLVLDDLDWTFDSSPKLKTSERVRRMPEDERSTAQVRQVYELLVKPHPAYGEFMERDGWAFARKIGDGAGVAGEIRREIVHQRVGLGEALLTVLRGVTGKK